MQKAFTYVRSSNHSNADVALENQKQKLTEYCETQRYEVKDSVCTIGDKHLGCQMLLELIDRAETEGIDTIVVASANRVGETPEEFEAIRKHLEGKNVRIETTDGTHVLFDYAELGEDADDISFGLTIMG